MMKYQSLILIDSNSIINRAFYGCKSALKSASGIPTGAVNGFFNSVFSMLDEYKPTHVCCLFDLKKPTFRHKLSADYKANRKPMPEDLALQMPIVKEILDLMGIKRIEKEGFEADDLIGTLSRIGSNSGMEVLIYSGDHDDYQLLDDNVSIIMPCSKKGMPPRIHYTAQMFMEENNVTPEEFIHVKALMGDNSDNIIGIDKVGPKTAFDLISKYKDIYGVIEHKDELTTKLRANLDGAIDKLELNIKLCTIDRNVPLDVSIDDFEMMTDRSDDDKQALFDKLSEYQLKSMIKKLKLNDLTPTFDISKVQDNDTSSSDSYLNDTLIQIDEFVKISDEDLINRIHIVDKETALETCRLIKDKSMSYASTHKEQTNSGFGVFFNPIHKAMIINVVATSDFYVFSGFDGTVFDMIIGDNAGVGNTSNTGNTGNIGNTGNAGFITFEYKNNSKFLDKLINRGIDVFDTKVCAYVLNKVEGAKVDFVSVFERMTGLVYPYNDKVSKQISMLDMISSPLDDKSVFIKDCKNLFLNNCVFLIQYEEIKRQNLQNLIYGIEMPLIKTLDRIERDGMYVSAPMLDLLHKEYSDRIKKLQEQIYDITGVTFNISSPKQLSEVLYDKLLLPKGKKNKSGIYSTSMDELYRLRPFSEVIDLIIEYRQLSKLDSTYAVGLKDTIDSDNRIRTTFTQVMTNTGRLSSTEPNLQNIPVKTEEGSKIRKAFTAPSGRKLVDADYSQIELRLLAHLSGDEYMCECFNNDVDIHKGTAMKLFKVSDELVTSHMRSVAKQVNFSILYGITPYGLSNDLKIGFSEAKELIDSYKQEFSGVNAFLEKLKADGEANGYVDTMFGRRRILNELNSTNHQVKEFGFRAAMNTPIQGSSADIIKLSMVEVDNKLKEKFPNARFVMQVHDEIIVECDNEEATEVSQMIKDIMENVVHLSIPLKVDVGIGDNWLEAK